MENSFSYQPAADRYERMPYKYCGKSGLQLPLISLGLWHNFGSVDNFDVATDMIKYAFDHGVTHFDLANNYGPIPGSAEINFGRILRENFQGCSTFSLTITYIKQNMGILRLGKCIPLKSDTSRSGKFCLYN